MGNQGKKLLNEDIKALYDKVVEDEKNADVTIMVVGDFINKNVRGSAAIKSKTDARDEAYTGCITLAMGAMKRQNAIFTVGHETGHILTDDFHFGEDYPSGVTIPLHQITRNLMRSGTSTKNSFRRSKRFVNLQIGKFRADLLKNP
jgi:hypothetical protein